MSRKILAGTIVATLLFSMAAIAGQRGNPMPDTEDGAAPPNPSGRWGLRAISLSEAVTDERASLSVSLLDLARKTHRRWCR